MNFRDSLKFGIFPEYELDLGTSVANSVYEYQKDILWCSTNKRFLQIEGPSIKKSFRNKFCCSLQIKNSDIIIGVSTKHFELEIWYLSANFLIPLQTGINTDQKTILHVLYSPKSHTIITIGSGIKTWNLQSSYYERKLSAIIPEVKVTLRKSFLPEFESGILSVPCFDSERELLYIPTPNGIAAYTLDGELVNIIVKIPSSIDNVYAFSNSKKDINKGKMIFADPCEGVTIWDFNGRLRMKFTNTAASLYFISYVDRENIVYLSGHNVLSILDVKTGRSFQCLSLDRTPNRIFIVGREPYKQICCVMSTKLIFYRIVIPWKKYLLNMPSLSVLEKVYRSGEASRLLVQCGTSFFKLVSPKTKANMTTAVTQSCYPPTGFLYDRGTHVYFRPDGKVFRLHVDEELTQQRDELFVVQNDETVSGFNTGVIPAQQIMNDDFGASKIDLCVYNGRLSYAIASPTSDLMIRDYTTFKVLFHASLTAESIVSMKSVPTINCIILIYTTTFILFDLEESAIASIAPECKGSNVLGVIGNNVILGYEDGSMIRFNVVDKNIGNFIDMRPHSQKVTSISFSPTFWITTSLDSTVCLFNYDWMMFYRIVLPVPLFCGIVLNGYRDILVATDSELMVINPVYQMFYGEIDDDHPLLDVFDTLDDYLDCNASAFEGSSSDDEAESFLSGFVNRRLPPSRRSPKKKSPKKNNISFDLREVERLKKLLDREEEIGRTLNNNTNSENNENNDNENQEANQIDEEEKNQLLREMEKFNERVPDATSTIKTESNETTEKQVNFDDNNNQNEDNKENENENDDEKKEKKKKVKREFDSSKFLNDVDDEMKKAKKKRKKKENTHQATAEAVVEEEIDMNNIKLFDSDNGSTESFDVPVVQKKVTNIVISDVFKTNRNTNTNETDNEKQDMKPKEPASPMTARSSRNKDKTNENDKAKDTSTKSKSSDKVKETSTKSKTTKKEKSTINKTSSKNNSKSSKNNQKQNLSPTKNKTSLIREPTDKQKSNGFKRNMNKQSATSSSTKLITMTKDGAKNDKGDEENEVNLNSILLGQDLKERSQGNKANKMQNLSKSNQNKNSKTNIHRDSKNYKNHQNYINSNNENENQKEIYSSSNNENLSNDENNMMYDEEGNGAHNGRNSSSKYIPKSLGDFSLDETRETMNFGRVLVKELKSRRRNLINAASDAATSQMFDSSMGGDIKASNTIAFTQCDTNFSENIRTEVHGSSLSSSSYANHCDPSLIVRSKLSRASSISCSSSNINGSLKRSASGDISILLSGLTSTNGINEMSEVDELNHTSPMKLHKNQNTSRSLPSIASIFNDINNDNEYIQQTANFSILAPSPLEYNSGIVYDITDDTILSPSKTKLTQDTTFETQQEKSSYIEQAEEEKEENDNSENQSQPLSEDGNISASSSDDCLPFYEDNEIDALAQELRKNEIMKLVKPQIVNKQSITDKDSKNKNKVNRKNDLMHCVINVMKPKNVLKSSASSSTAKIYSCVLHPKYRKCSEAEIVRSMFVRSMPNQVHSKIFR